MTNLRQIMNLKSPNSKRLVLYSTVLISLQVQQPQRFLLLISIILYSDQFFLSRLPRSKRILIKME